ncbi:MAG: hypothetical protein PWQ20_920 [Thermotogaceae bacterium]|nr:hypothetical protein [Thermotogaceae bacterium]
MAKETRLRILKAAQLAFSEKGFNGVSVEEIAEMAGVNKTVVFYYFPSKADLFAAVWEQSISELEEHIFEEIKDESVYLKKVKKFLKSYIDFVRNKRDIMKLIEREKVGVLSEKNDSIISRKLKEKYKNFVKKIVDLLNEGKELREIPNEVSAEETANIITNSIGATIFDPNISLENMEKIILRTITK